MSAKIIAQVSDCHLFENRQKVGYNQINPYNSLTAVLALVRTHQPDILLVTGDISADGSEQSYHDFIALIEQFKLLDRLYVIAGNHDNTTWFDQLLGQYDLAKQTGLKLLNWSIHGVDTRYKGTLGHLSAEQLKQLDIDIINSDSQFHVVACHHHPFACGGWMDKHKWVNGLDFTKMIQQHQNVRAVIYGHIHSQHITHIEHSTYASCPSSCWQWSTQPEFAIDPSLPGYNILKLDESGKLDLSTHRLNQEPLATHD